MSKAECRRFDEYLLSPFFNQRTDIRNLFDWLQHNALEPRDKTWAAVYGKAPFDAQKLRLVMSYLQRHLEHFLAYQQWVSRDGAQETDLLRALRQRRLDAQFPEARLQVQLKLGNQPLRNSGYWQQMSQLYWEEARFESLHRPSETFFLEQLSDSADILWLSQKLRYMCLARAQQIVYKTAHQLRFRTAIEAMIKQDDLLQEPAVKLWYYCLHMLESPDKLEYFNLFKTELLANDQCFDADEIRDLHLFAVNYCIRRANIGDKEFSHDIMDFYKNGLNKGYLLENGAISRFTYHNIVGAGLQTQEYDWVEAFIQKYKPALERSYRESSYKFNLARLEFARKRYDVVLPLLHNSNFYEPLMALAAKSLALKIYYESEAWDLLDSHLEAMKSYIRRKTNLGYHRNYYLNLVKFTQKMLLLDNRQSVAIAMLRDRIQAEEILADKAWLIAQLARKG